jgi:ketosteroid isomerase-like protein
MVVETPKVLSDYKIACNSHDVNKIVSFFADDCVLEDVARGIVKHGKKEVTDSFNSMFVEFPDLKYELRLFTESAIGDVYSVPCLVLMALSHFPFVQLQFFN